MDIRFYHIDAFTNHVFAGNPAGVCFLEKWVDGAILQSIAEENNLPETAFLVQAGDHYELRWFTPRVEIDLCGHATLASAFAVFEYVNPRAGRVDFETKSGRLSVVRRGDLLIMDFPTRRPEPYPPPDNIDKILGIPPSETLRSRDLLVVYEEEEQVRRLKPDMAGVASLDCFAVIVTAPGENCDFVSRFFAPGAGIPEDPVTGSSHCTLIPYWSERLRKKELHAFQLSERGGELFCEDWGERVAIGGRAVTYLSGTMKI
ncbi:Phenazine biosynthesis-like protein [uncultured archaeon]|nr:Phenazine biosynthesis-like protein [uncultured archaeon]